MKVLKLGVAVTALVVMAFAPAKAASPITEAFLANVRPNVEFLDRSSKLATERSASAAVREYAQGEMADAINTATLIERWAPARIAVASAAPDANALITGRSVSVDGLTGGMGQAANGRSPMGDKDLDALAKLSGKKFLDAFWLKQLDALSQLRADYRAYADDGDDAALVAMAQRALPEVEHRLALLSKI